MTSWNDRTQHYHGRQLMTTTSCPTWAQDCHDCGQSIPSGVWRQYVDGVSLRVRHINGCPAPSETARLSVKG
jgi:hypothetical protein